MKEPNSCKHDEQQVVLYFYGELDEAAHTAMEAQLHLCPACRTVLTELELMQQAVPAAPMLTPDADTLAALRRGLVARLPRPRPSLRQQAAAWWNRLRWLEPAPLMIRAALAVVLVGVGFWLGRRPGGGVDTLETLLMAEGVVQSKHGTIQPAFAGVRDVTFNPATGLVEIQYNTVNEVAVQGRPGDAAVRRLLLQALRDEENPIGRLYAAKALQAAPPAQAAPDSQLVAALVFMLENDTNEGIRLQAMDALRTLHGEGPLNKAAQATLLGVLLHDDNSALRIEALQLLMQHAQAQQDLAAYLDAVRRDPNDFIRFQAETMLEQLEGPQPLEQLPGGSGLETTQGPGQ